MAVSKCPFMRISKLLHISQHRNPSITTYSKWSQIRACHAACYCQTFTSCHVLTGAAKRSQHSKLQRNFTTSSAKLNILDNDKKMPSILPSFSTNNYKGFTATPSVKVVADIIVQGVPNHSDFASSITKSLQQSPAQLVEGSLMAIESMTEMLERDCSSKITSDDADIKDMLTPDCYSRLVKCYPDMLNKRDQLYLINTPKEDVFFSWIHELRGGMNGTLSMKVCTLSFPNYGFMLRKLQENIDREKAFTEEMLRRGMVSKLQKEDIKKDIEDFVQSKYDPRKHIDSHEIGVSNFSFIRGPDKEDPWIISEISMKTASEAFSKFAAFRWRGRLFLSLKGWNIRNILRFDYFSDYFIILTFVLLTITLLLGQI